MRITIQITCDDTEDAQRVIKKLSAPDNTWVDQLLESKVSEARLDKIMGRETGGTTGKKVDTDDEEASHPTTHPRKNVSPGTPSIGKIGSTTKEALFNDLVRDVQPSAKFTEHAKLLWSRGEIKFDGVNYYL